MRALGRLIVLGLCGTWSFLPSAAMAFEMQQPSTPLSISIFGMHPFERDNAVGDPRLHTPCHVSGAEAQAIERNTSDPCLAEESAPGSVCFARLGRDLPAAPEAPMAQSDFCAN